MCGTRVANCLLSRKVIMTATLALVNLREGFVGLNQDGQHSPHAQHILNLLARILFCRTQYAEANVRKE